MEDFVSQVQNPTVAAGVDIKGETATSSPSSGTPGAGPDEPREEKKIAFDPGKLASVDPRRVRCPTTYHAVARVGLAEVSRTWDPGSDPDGSHVEDVAWHAVARIDQAELDPFVESWKDQWPYGTFVRAALAAWQLLGDECEPKVFIRACAEAFANMDPHLPEGVCARCLRPSTDVCSPCDGERDDAGASCVADDEWSSEWSGEGATP